MDKTKILQKSHIHGSRYPIEGDKLPFFFLFMSEILLIEQVFLRIHIKSVKLFCIQIDILFFSPFSSHSPDLSVLPDFFPAPKVQNNLCPKVLWQSTFFQTYTIFLKSSSFRFLIHKYPPDQSPRPLFRHSLF